MSTSRLFVVLGISLFVLLSCLRLSPHLALLFIRQQQRQQLNKAIKHYANTVSIVPSHTAALSALARLLLYVRKDYRQALKVLERLDELKACAHEDHLNLALLYHYIFPQYQAAEDHYLAAIEAYPEALEIHNHLAQLYELYLGDLGAAHRQYSFLLSLPQSSTSRTANQAALARIESRLAVNMTSASLPQML
eukprot:m.165144 g.165144  ORF g.165144 m.165144 type:complete len:193 (+) comp16421_c6_seq3:40-618(+)